MIPYLLENLIPQYPTLNALHYITSRSVLSLLFSFALSMVLFPLFIRFAKAKRIGQTIRQEGPPGHTIKGGTPTMGGTILLLCALGSTVLWAQWSNHLLWVVILHTVAFGVIGFLDDILKTKNNSQGLRGSIKLLLGAAVLSCAIVYLHKNGMTFLITFPFFKKLIISTPFLVIPFVFVVVLGTSNAANLTDGLDGLLGGTLLIALLTMGVLCYLTSHARIADYLYIAHVPEAGELTVLCSCLIGTLTGFLWHNCHPAAVFMGDSGSLSIGAALGLISVLIRQEFLLLLCAGVIAAEAVSVIIQVGSYKLLGRRVFKMAPLHHHFELKGWHETQIIVRFWILSFLLAMITIITLKLR